MCIRDRDEQASFTIVEGDMKLEVRSNKVKSFDERADLAAERLVDYLKRYAMGRELGTDDPMSVSYTHLDVYKRQR